MTALSRPALAWGCPRPWGPSSFCAPLGRRAGALCTAEGRRQQAPCQRRSSPSGWCHLYCRLSGTKRSLAQSPGGPRTSRRSPASASSPAEEGPALGSWGPPSPASGRLRCPASSPGGRSVCASSSRTPRAERLTQLEGRRGRGKGCRMSTRTRSLVSAGTRPVPGGFPQAPGQRGGPGGPAGWARGGGGRPWLPTETSWRAGRGRHYVL